MPPKRIPPLEIPMEDHYVGRMTYKGSGRLTKLKKRFEEHGLLGRVNESIFGPFFIAPPFSFSGALVHTLLLRKVKSLRGDEVHFLMGPNLCKFGVHDFSIITGMSCSCPPLAVDIEPHITSSRLVDTYFSVEPEKNIRLSMLERAFSMCDVPDDLYKLGLVYFVEGILLGAENDNAIWRDSLSMVEDLDYFEKYPWGSLSFDTTVKQFNRDMKAIGGTIPGKKAKKITEVESFKGFKVEEKYTCKGYPPALQYWAYETILDLQKEHAKPCGFKFPRMLQWESIGQPKHLHLKDVLARRHLSCISILRPRPNERDFFDVIYQRTGGDAPRYAMLQNMIQPAPEDGKPYDPEAEAAAVAEIAVEAGIFVEDAPTESAPDTSTEPTSALAPAPGAYEEVLGEIARLSGAVDDVKATLGIVLKNQEVILEKLATLGGIPTPAHTHAPTPTDDVEYDILPSCYEPSVGEATPSQPVQTVLGKRTRQRPVRYEDYTPAAKKPKFKDPVTILPLKVLDQDMLTTFNRWVLGEIDNSRPRKLECCDGTPVLFLKLKVAKEWLEKNHPDAANYLIRRRLFEFPKTYPVKATVLDSSFAQYIPARYEEFKKNGRTYQWDSDILDFLKGDAKKYKKPWGDCNEVYFHWCMENRHWVLCEINFADWMITVFDSDHSNFSHNKFSELIEP
ncbi:uncharacterized protein LOC133818226 isoform X2 [Humulus lupulus]|nr:uncharacterized protein LOC133818226 isoform X2 [Humulus lupulus]XP_062106961.1 uncharacterized protein LOC133818226 isoform X2 [Humulus lupulus]XP_062106962.1 uncharacterized protein LOC133818226 isoform X2 [Humulus lupulus]